MLTDVALRRLRAPSEGQVEIKDVPGLVVRVTPRGTKSFSVIYKVPGERGVAHNGRPLKGKQHRVTLGTYPDVSLSEARRRAAELLEQVEQGHDPRNGMRQQNTRRFGNTVESVTRRVIDDIKDRVSTWRDVERVLTNHVLPTRGTLPIADLGRQQCAELIDLAKGEHGVARAREVRKHLSRLLNFALDRGLIDASPLANMKRADLAYEPDPRPLSDAELRAVWRAIPRLGKSTIEPCIRLLLLTGQRLDEWREATWENINAQERVLVVPRRRQKSRRDHVVPLVDSTWAIVEKLPRLNANSHLFPASRGDGAVSIDDKVRGALRYLALQELRKERGDDAKFPDWTLHDFRDTLKTRLDELRVPAEVRDAVAGHTQANGVDRHYNRYDKLREKREALQLYAEHVLSVVK